MAKPHMVAINDVWIDIPAREGWLLLCENYDRPGTIGAVGTLLGKHNTNINFMTVESIEGQDRALMALIVDGATASAKPAGSANRRDNPRHCRLLDVIVRDSLRHPGQACSTNAAFCSSSTKVAA